MLATLALILVVVGVVLLVLGAFGVTAAITPYGMQGGITLVVVGVVIYVVLLVLNGHTVGY